ncbi:GNAT family N-acetyltransferase [Nocardioides sp. Leaf307]|uniref:GNAT family N-acetyltransferase n=1 Tax=Nocardioides sp. Leaf307 TaxID=1736331 RepID=UPI0007033C2B|nr:GNAT family N-acetyltransferase [Nocardioides sp. Leaf307]KQQ43301.1 hypothetical protein ASF50_04910 [Nocardioides sp. Leaf307]
MRDEGVEVGVGVGVDGGVGEGPTGEPAREVSVEELYAGCGAALLHHQVPRAGVRRAWLAGPTAAAWWGPGGRPGGPVDVVTAVGPPALLGPVLTLAAATSPTPGRLSVEARSAHVVPAPWRQVDPWTWHWMRARRGDVPLAPTPEVVDLGLAHPEEVDAVLDAANPGSFARSDTPGVLTWHGVRRPGPGHPLVAVGALAAQPDGSGHLRGVAVLPGERGRGLGRAVSTSLTRAGLALADVVTLGVYTDNAPALAVYASLGYETVHTFVSGPTRARSSTTAAVPSR